MSAEREVSGVAGQNPAGNPSDAELLSEAKEYIRLTEAAGDILGYAALMRRLVTRIENGREDSARLNFLEVHGQSWFLPEHRVTVKGARYWEGYGADEWGATMRCDTLRATVDALRASGNAGEVPAASATNTPEATP